MCALCELLGCLAEGHLQVDLRHWKGEGSRSLGCGLKDLREDEAKERLDRRPDAGKKIWVRKEFVDWCKDPIMEMGRVEWDREWRWTCGGGQDHCPPAGGPGGASYSHRTRGNYEVSEETLEARFKDFFGPRDHFGNVDWAAEGKDREGVPDILGLGLGRVDGRVNSWADQEAQCQRHQVAQGPFVEKAKDDVADVSLGIEGLSTKLRVGMEGMIDG
jgi:hypothetical protein